MARPAPPPLSDAHLAPGLYVTATPIGNLRDVTLRALDVLAGCDLILAEDTRVTAKLLTAYGLSKPMQRFDEHAVAKALPKLLERLAAGERIALCSDAGTPLVSDPGARLVTAALAQGSAVYPLPGASAVLAALVAAGLPSERFLFAGFPPPKGVARDRCFAELAQVPATLVFFEGPPRLSSSLAAMAKALGDRPAVVARELTKLHETMHRGTLSSLAADPALGNLKGEIVVVVGPPLAAAAHAVEDADALLDEAMARLSPGEAASEIAKRLSLPRKAVYARALARKVMS
ncbi:MAG: 16S rRNA (cytidine(1402)-2'-O)-methyltransferase [Alphaproteobacteria bacterium]